MYKYLVAYNPLSCFRVILFVVAFFFCTCLVVNAQNEPPFKGKLSVKLTRIVDRWDEEGYYISGTNPAYYYDRDDELKQILCAQYIFLENIRGAQLIFASLQ